MSYSYGGRQSIEDFNRDNQNVSEQNRGVVKGCNPNKLATTQDVIYYTFDGPGIYTNKCDACHNGVFNANAKIVLKTIIADVPVPAGYAANVSHYNCTAIGSGYQKYPGLLKAEFESRALGGVYLYDAKTKQFIETGVDHPQYKQEHWAGTDCSNLVGKSVEAAKNNVPWISVAISSALYSGNYCLIDRNSESEAIKLVNTYSIAAGKEEAQDEDIAKFLRKGDVISYDGHVSLVYSNKWGESQWTEGGIWSKKYRKFVSRKLYYDIIHAFGGLSYKFNSDGEVFSRKVLVTGDYIGTPPTGIGRIKLWD
jgi:hypothetical protein